MKEEEVYVLTYQHWYEGNPYRTEVLQVCESSSKADLLAKAWSQLYFGYIHRLNLPGEYGQKYIRNVWNFRNAKEFKETVTGVTGDPRVAELLASLMFCRGRLKSSLTFQGMVRQARKRYRRGNWTVESLLNELREHFMEILVLIEPAPIERATAHERILEQL